MKDKLENFISNNRTDFDDLEPNPETWNQVAKRINKKSDFNWIWKAAAILLMVFSGVLLYERSQNTIIEDSDENGLAFSEELLEAESFYTKKIADKRLLIETAASERGLDNGELLEELNELDEMYDRLKGNLEKNTNDERLISAMIINLQMRVEILNRQLEILERLKTYQDNETII